MNHTPAPWPIRISESEIDIIGPYKSNKHICTLKNSGEKDDIANAHLIAAAPELLEALEELQKTIFIDVSHPLSIDWAKVKDILTKSIAKAKGQ